ncbi:MAG: AraC family transcriptional regulator [Acidimicrobiia bacterium]
MEADFELLLDEGRPGGALVEAVARHTPVVGRNPSVWPGLTFYRFESPEAPQWDDVVSLALCVVVQGRKRVRVAGQDYFYDPFDYFVLSRGMRFEAEILEGSPGQPFLSLVLQVPPEVVQRVIADMREPTMALFQRPLPAAPAAYVAAADRNFTDALLRFLVGLETESDRRVLAPIYLHEMVYRVMQSEQCARLANAAVKESESNPITAAISYMREDLSRPVTVAELAEVVAMSQSAFAHLFKSVAGVSPYQFIKRLRLDRARAMLVEEGRSVSETAAAVGYASLSHFINEFKRHFGVTPGGYASLQSGVVPLSVSRATGGTG